MKIRYKSLVPLAVFLLPFAAMQAQGKYYTKTGKIQFLSVAPLEDIEAKNSTAAAVLDGKSGVIAFSVLMKGFEFEKALMQEHFNDHYVESDKYPKAEFKGTVVNNSSINYAKEGSYPAHVKGRFTLHGVTKEMETYGILKVERDAIRTTATFYINLSNYKISIPALVKDKVSNRVKIIVDCRLDALKAP